MLMAVGIAGVLLPGAGWRADADCRGVSDLAENI